MSAQKIKITNKFYRFARGFCSFFFKLSGYKVIGKENIPEDKSIIIVANHTTAIDPILLACAFPYQIRFMAKDEFRQNSFTRKLMNGLGAVFVKRGEADLAAIRTMIKLLKEENAIGIFPEGSRNHDTELQDFKSGPVFIAYKTSCRILPVGIKNAKDFLCFWRKDKAIIIGKPIKVVMEDGIDRARALDEFSLKLQSEVRDLLISDVK